MVTQSDIPAANAFESMDFGVFTNSWVFMTVIAALCSLFLAVTFIQSGFNKLTEYKENKLYFISQMEKTLLRHLAFVIWPLIILLELCSGLISLGGIVMVLVNGSIEFLGLGCFLSSVTLICLLLGQRMAKDYAGASTLTGYFIISILGLFGYALSF